MDGQEIPTADKRVDRRRFLRRGAIAAAVAGAGAATLVPQPAGAADNNSIAIGSAQDANNTGTTRTTLNGSQFRALNGNGAISLVGEHTTSNAIGVEARSSDGAQLRLAPNGIDAVSGSAKSVTAGSLLADSTNEALWYVYADGTTGSSGTAGMYALNGTPVFAMFDTPVRQYDSRAGFPPNSGVPSSNLVKGELNAAAGQERVVWVANNSAIFVTAVLLTVTMVNTTNAGYLAVGRGDFVWNPNAPFSSTNWYQNSQVVATTVVTRIDSSGQIKVRSGGTGATDFLVDLVGVWFIP